MSLICCFIYMYSFSLSDFCKKYHIDEQYSPLFGSILNLYVNVLEHFLTHLYCMVPFSHFDWTAFKTCPKPTTFSLSNPNLSSFILLTHIDKYLYYNGSTLMLRFLIVTSCNTCSIGLIKGLL